MTRRRLQDVRIARNKAKVVLPLLLVFVMVLCWSEVMHHLRLWKQRFLDEESATIDIVRNQPSLDASSDSTGEGNMAKEGNSSFSACLMWADDNFRLPEWIAYHHYMMNLTHLVVAVDELSRSSPLAIFDKWRAETGMTIEIWTRYADYSKNVNMTTIDPAKDNMAQKLKKHRRRQSQFYRACALHLKRQGRAWTTFHDNDEYLVVTPEANVSRDEISSGSPGVVLKILQRYTNSSGGDANDNSQAPDTTAGAMNKTKASMAASSMTYWTEWISSRPCTTFPRVLFSALEDGNVTIEASDNIPAAVADLADRLDTLRYRYQATSRQNGARDGLGKALIDVSRLPDNVLEISRWGSAHRPFAEDSVCKHAFHRPGVLPLVFHHYLGSWEAFSFRDDARKGGLRTREKWVERSKLREGGRNDDIRPWIAGFTKWVGPARARSLLADAGLPRNYKKSERETVEWAKLTP
jgi:hypothetical protein